MIAQTAAEKEALKKPRQAVSARVQIRDDTNTWRDWTNLFGVDYIQAINLTETADSYRNGSISLNWNRFYDNASPFMTGSRLEGYLDVNRDIRIDFKVYPLGGDPSSYDWHPVCVGVIDDFDLSQMPGKIQFKSKIESNAQKDFIRSVNEYGDNGGAKDVEDVIQDLLTAWSDTTVTLVVPVATTLQVDAYNQSKQTLWEAIKYLSTQIGWDLRTQINALGGQTLVFEEPNRAIGTPDFTFGKELIRSYGQFSNSLENVRNHVKVVYYDNTNTTDRGDDGLSEVERLHTTTSPAHDPLLANVTGGSSIDLYGRRYAEFVEGENSLINSAARAQDFADVVIADLADPTLLLGVELATLFWPVEINDYYQLDPDETRFELAQKLSVYGWAIKYDASNGASTSLSLRGKPALGLNTYLRRERRPGQRRNSDDRAPSAPVLAGTDYVMSELLDITWPVNRDFGEALIYASATSPVVANAANLIGSARTSSHEVSGRDPNVTMYYIAKFIDRDGNVSSASNEVAGTPSAIPRTYLDPTMLNAVRAVRTADQTAMGDGAIVAFNSEVYDPGSDYNITSYNYKAPASGIYSFEARIVSAGVSNGGVTNWRVRMKRAASVFVISGELAAGTAAKWSEINAMIALDAGDVISLTVEVNGTDTPQIDMDYKTSYFSITPQLSNQSRT